MLEIWPPNFCGPLFRRVHCRPPSALHSPRSTSAVWDFCALWPIVHTSQSFEPTISMPNSHGASPHNPAMERNNIACNFFKNPFAGYPFSSAAGGVKKSRFSGSGKNNRGHNSRGWRDFGELGNCPVISHHRKSL